MTQGERLLLGIASARSARLTHSAPGCAAHRGYAERVDPPVMLFISGTHTNLPEALSLDPGIAEHIASVTIMGGSLYAHGNIESAWPVIHSRVAEWNI